MSVLSTLRLNHPRANCSAPVSADDFKNVIPSSHAMNIDELGNQLGSSPSREHIVMVPATPFTPSETLGMHSHCDTTPDVLAPYAYGGVPTDGGSSWYCGECGDGPYGAWQPACQKCQHTKCNTCTSESS